MNMTIDVNQVIDQLVKQIGELSRVAAINNATLDNYKLKVAELEKELASIKEADTTAK